MSSIAFSVKAGPLSQVALEIASLGTAYQLATGAYGWYKSHERSKSLTELLSVTGGELVSTSAFDLNLYRNIRLNEGMMQGVVVQDQIVQGTNLPKGSTAIPDHPGTACLRALTAGLLCVYRIEATIEILQDLIPFSLVHYHQDDVTIEVEGALLASLRHWISTIALEEDSDVFRKYMLDRLTVQQARMMGAAINDVMDIDDTSVNEIPLVIGVLR